VTACLAISNIVKSSLGPVGLDKMLVDQIGDVTITNDGATILKQLEVEHPAAKVLVELSDRQDKEVGDGTTSVVIVAAELLKRANELIKQNIHPTTVIGGYKSAMREAVKHIKKTLLVGKDQISDDIVQAAAKTSMSSKIIGSKNSFFSKMVCDAMKLCERKSESSGKVTYAVNGVNIVKVHGRSQLESELVDGYALNHTRMAQGTLYINVCVCVCLFAHPLYIRPSTHKFTHT
jgi:T-complex protein 1 subunit alpha